MEIPEKIRGFNFVLIGEEKKPFEKGWQKKIHRIDDPVFQVHIQQGKSYGVQSNNSSIILNGKTYFLIIIDFDKKEFQDKVINQFPETFTTTSGSPKQCVHLWFASDNNKPFKVKDEQLNTLSDVIGAGNQVIAPGSKHSSGSIYSVVKDVPFTFMPYAEIESILKPHDKSPKKIEKIQKQFIPKGISNDISQKILNSVSMEEILKRLGVDTSKNPTNCPFHSSARGKCLSWNEETAHCFHCDDSWNKFSLVRKSNNLTDKETFEWFADKGGMSEELTKYRREYIKKEQLKEQIFTRRGQIESFWKIQPFFYDAAKLFWIWDNELRKWKISDEVDFLNAIQEKLGLETIDSKARIELTEGFKQIGRKHTQKKIKKGWVQFKNKIYNGKNGEYLFEASPEYFVRNPIPWEVGLSDETPTIDKLYIDWVGEMHKKELEEATTYTITPDRFMQRIIGLCGGGSNGKGTYMKLIERFIGRENMVSSELKNLSEDKFEPAVLYGKLVCVMGEVSYDDLKNTNHIKKLAGEDLLSFQFKGKTPFTDENTAVCLSLTNALPVTPDKSLGFYRKWWIIDFPNQFDGIKYDIISTIPDIEFNNLALKCLNQLKKLYEIKKFTNEGSFEERITKYEERSNPVLKFIDEYCKEEPNSFLSLREFTNRCNEFLKSKHLRIMTANQIGKVLRNEGFIVGNRKIDDISAVVILNLEWCGLVK